MTSFEEYLKAKKINASAFLQAEPDRYRAWERLHSQVHVASFEAQKKFLINPTRRKYPVVAHDKS